MKRVSVGVDPYRMHQLDRNRWIPLQKKNSENDDKTRLEKFTILHYHRDEHARKLLESIRRDCTQEENDPVNRTLDATSDTPTRSEKAVTVGSDSVSHESMQRLSPNC